MSNINFQACTANKILYLSRYADIIVHRLLAVAVGADCTYPDLTDKQKMAEICKNINFRHKMAQYSQRASVAFHTQVREVTRFSDYAK